MLLVNVRIVKTYSKQSNQKKKSKSITSRYAEIEKAIIPHKNTSLFYYNRSIKLFASIIYQMMLTQEFISLFKPYPPFLSNKKKHPDYKITYLSN